MSKYFRLKDFLAGRDQDFIPMTFAEIETVLKFPLPASKRYPAWWSNNPSNNPMTREWLDAGYETESVNTGSGRLVFRRVRRARTDGGSTTGSPASHLPRHPGFGFMKGLLTVEEGYDLTSPSDEDWHGGYFGEDRLNG